MNFKNGLDRSRRGSGDTSRLLRLIDPDKIIVFGEVRPAAEIQANVCVDRGASSRQCSQGEAEPASRRHWLSGSRALLPIAQLVGPDPRRTTVDRVARVPRL